MLVSSLETGMPAEACLQTKACWPQASTSPLQEHAVVTEQLQLFVTLPHSHSRIISCRTDLCRCAIWPALSVWNLLPQTVLISDSCLFLNPDFGTFDSIRLSLRTWHKRLWSLRPYHHHFWHAPLRVCSAKCRHQSPEWTITKPYQLQSLDLRSCIVINHQYEDVPVVSCSYPAVMILASVSSGTLK